MPFYVNGIPKDIKKSINPCSDISFTKTQLIVRLSSSEVGLLSQGNSGYEVFYLSSGNKSQFFSGVITVSGSPILITPLPGGCIC